MKTHPHTNSARETASRPPSRRQFMGGLAIAKVNYGTYLRFVWPLLAACLVIVGVILAVAATAGIS